MYKYSFEAMRSDDSSARKLTNPDLRNELPNIDDVNALITTQQKPYIKAQ